MIQASNRTPTSEGSLLRAAADLATDVAAMVLEFRERIGPPDAEALSREVLSITDFIERAGRAPTPEDAAGNYRDGRTVALRTLVALERLAARSRVPLLRSAELHQRLGSLARGLAALAGDPPRSGS